MRRKRVKRVSSTAELGRWGRRVTVHDGERERGCDGVAGDIFI